MKQMILSNMMIADLCQQLSLLLRAGVRLSDGLYLLTEDERDPEYRKFLSAIAADIEEGTFLCDALAKTNSFPVHVCGLLEVGERVGRTEETLMALSKYYEERERTNRQLKNALTYPAILLMMMLVVIIVLLSRVLPVFEDVYASLGGTLTGIAGLLFHLGTFLNSIMPGLIAFFVLLVLAIIIFAMSHTVRNKILSVWHRHFGDRGISRKMNDAQFAQALSMAYSSGLPLEEGITLAGSLLKDCPAAVKRCETCRQLLEEGAELSVALGDTNLLPASSCRMLTLGMRSGTGDAALEEISRRLSDEATEALSSKVAKVEPALVLITSLLVGAILLSVMLPLMDIMKAIG